MSPEDKICLNVPLFHAFGLLMGQTNILNTGCTIILESPTFNPVKSLETIAREKCSIAYGTPTMWVSGDDERHTKPKFHTILHIRSRLSQGEHD